MEKYNEYVLEQTWTLKNKEDEITCYGKINYPIKKYYMGRGNAVGLSDLSVKGFKRKGDALNRIKVFDEMATKQKGYSLYNVETAIKKNVILRKGHNERRNKTKD